MISHVTVVGAGVIGSGWIARFLAAGLAVRVWDPDASSYAGSRDAVARALLAMARRDANGVRHADTDGLAAIYCDSLALACADAQWVQEAAPESLSIKTSLYSELEPLIDSDCVLASSSSGLLPTQLQAELRHPERFFVAHPFNPVYLLPLVELVPGKQTAADQIDRAQTFLRQLAMRPLVVRKEIEGYLSDRLQEALWREILHLIKDGVATTAELDDAVRYGPGLRWAIMGTCLTFHLAGGKAGMRHMLEQFGPALQLPWTHLQAPELTDELVEKMVEGTAQQAGNQSVAELETLRDDALVSIMGALDTYRSKLDALGVSR